MDEKDALERAGPEGSAKVVGAMLGLYPLEDTRRVRFASRGLGAAAVLVVVLAVAAVEVLVLFALDLEGTYVVDTGTKVAGATVGT